MSVRLETSRHINGIAFAAICGTKATCFNRFIATGASGAKLPLAVLFRSDGVTWALDITGAPVALDEVERKWPGMRARFEADVQTIG